MQYINKKTHFNKNYYRMEWLLQQTYYMFHFNPHISILLDICSDKITLCNIFRLHSHISAQFFFILLHFEENGTIDNYFLNFPLFFYRTLSFTSFNVSKDCFDSRKIVTYNLKQLRFFKYYQRHHAICLRRES